MRLQFPALPDKGAGARMNKAAPVIDVRHFTHRLPLALLFGLLNFVPALARNVQCPAVWPGVSSKSKVKDAAVYINDQTELLWEELQHGTRVEGAVSRRICASRHRKCLPFLAEAHGQVGHCGNDLTTGLTCQVRTVAGACLAGA